METQLMKMLLCAVMTAGAAMGQVGPGTVSGPVLGMVFDRAAGGIRPLLGVPGASRLGQILADGSGLSDAAVSAEGGYALGVDADSGEIALVSGGGRKVLAPRGNALAVSPQGTAAAVYSRETGKVQIFVGMPGDARLLREVALDRAPIRMAVSDDGTQFFVVGRAPRQDETIVSYAAGSTPQTVRTARRLAAMEFVPGSSTALIAEPDAVLLVSPQFGTQVVADGKSGLAGVAGVAGSSDGGRVVIAMRSGQVLLRDLKASTQVALTCDCVPTGAWRLRGKAVFRLNETGNGALWLLDADGAEPRLLFVASADGASQ